MKKSMRILIAIVLLGLLTACSNSASTQESLSDEDKIATIVAGTLSAIPTVTLTPMPTDTPVVDEWIWHNIDLYSLKLKLPTGWTVSEANRKPEPTGMGNPIIGHDCAEYRLASADNLSVLWFRPVCGFAEGFPGSYPPDTIIINPQSENDKIGRYFTDGKFVYAEVLVHSYEDLTGKHEETVCISPPTVRITKKDGSVRASIDLEHLGDQTNIDKILTTADEIILSISEQ
ncbi:MAG TPA: hypothetical protein VFC02_08970 [Anaerolineales bacterium]|nr:hypothetical protein [Anaerolineales bacterium]